MDGLVDKVLEVLGEGNELRCVRELIRLTFWNNWKHIPSLTSGFEEW